MRSVLVKTFLFSLVTILLIAPSADSRRWGFFAHRRINRLAVFTLPVEMFGFYKKHIQYITEEAVKPDARRYAVKWEAPRHYLDADIYGDSAIYKLPRYWKQAVEMYTEDTLMAYGIVPWHIQTMKYRLEKAFKEKDVPKILQMSAEIGHYIGDANVPLHTTENYNGQLTGQYGIHGFWESRLPELFVDTYDFFVGPPDYLDNTQLTAWEAVTNAHEALDSVLTFEKQLTEEMGEDRKWSFENKNGSNVKVYSREFSEAYHRMLNGQVERRMRAAIKMTSDFWYTCWVDAGQPNLNELAGLSEVEIEENKKEIDLLMKTKSVPSREHDNE